jgi:predicted transcriptional regulator
LKLSNEENDRITKNLGKPLSQMTEPLEKLVKRGWLGIISEHVQHTVTITQAGLAILEKAQLDLEGQKKQ